MHCANAMHLIHDTANFSKANFHNHTALRIAPDELNSVPQNVL